MVFSTLKVVFLHFQGIPLEPYLPPVVVSRAPPHTLRAIPDGGMESRGMGNAKGQERKE